jgi:murein DD-endopeptidase MepM/ murein hydrolase activator NlpD
MRRALALIALALLLGVAALLYVAARGRFAEAPATPATAPPGPPASPTRGAPLAAPTAAPTRPPTPARPPTPSTPPTATPSTPPAATPAPAAALVYGYPIGLPGRPPGDGFLIRHGVQVENTWYNPGHWHAGEDWYALEGDTGGAQVYAASAGEVVYADGNYPGRVVIVAHPDGLFSMYGHLDPALAVVVGDTVARGQRLGSVLAQRGGRAPSHLHFEIRTFLSAPEVNGASPRYGFRCGVSCPPGPGYWPISAPDLPVDLGWRNPTHVIARRMVVGDGALGEAVVAAGQAAPRASYWSAPPDDPTRRELGAIALEAGARYPLLAIWAGDEAPRETGAEAYRLWYQLALGDGVTGWVQAAVPSADETGGDGRPASVRLILLPAAGPAGSRW